MANKKLQDLRNMEHSNMMSTAYQDDVQEQLDAYLMDFTSTLGKKTISQLCEIYELSLASIDTINKLQESISKSFFSGFLQSNLLCDTPIIGHYEASGLHLFAFQFNSLFYCDKCQKCLCSVVSIYYSEDIGYGICEFTFDDTFKYIKDNIRTFSDVWEFINEQSDISSYPLLV